MKNAIIILAFTASWQLSYSQKEKVIDRRHREQAAQIEEGVEHKEIKPAEKRRLQREQEKIQRYEDRNRNPNGELSRRESRKANRMHDEAQKNINEARNNNRGKKHKRHA